MVSKFAFDPGRRRRLRRLALYAFGGFCVVSAVLHFTIGSLVAMLFPGIQAPPEVQQAVSILTIYHLVPDQQKPLTPTPEQQRQIALHNVVQPKPKDMPVQHQLTISRAANSALSSIIAPSRKASLASSSTPKESSSRTSMSEVAMPNGLNPAAVRPNQGTANGTSGSAAGEDPSFPGRQVPTGPVWTDNGPPGTGSSAGGIILEGGGNGSGDHDGCAPPRGGFF